MDVWVASTSWLLWTVVLCIWAQLSLWDSAFTSLGYIPRSGIAGSYSNSVCNFLRNHCTAFCSSCTLLYSHKQCSRVLISLHPRWYILFSVLFVCLLVFGWACCIRKFLGQELNSNHSSNPRCCSDKAESLTCCSTIFCFFDNSHPPVNL